MPRLLRRLLVVAALLMLGVVAVMALRSSPYVGELPFVPQWLGDWADRNGNVRNVPAFMLLAFGLMAAFGRNPGFVIGNGVAVLFECSQVFLPKRTFDWADIGFSCLGVCLAAVLWEAGRRGWRAWDKSGKGGGGE